MEQTRTVWHMQLDHQRNRVLRINLLIRRVLWGRQQLVFGTAGGRRQQAGCPLALIDVLSERSLCSIMSLGCVTATIPAAYLGMNVSSGLEEVTGVFWPLVQVGGGLGGGGGEVTG
jgi:hypothetical protein